MEINFRKYRFFADGRTNRTNVKKIVNCCVRCPR